MKQSSTVPPLLAGASAAGRARQSTGRDRTTAELEPSLAGVRFTPVDAIDAEVNWAHDPVPRLDMAVEVEVVRGFHDFYAAERGRLVAVLAVTLGDRDLAAEAADEAMIRALLRWESLAASANPAGWVFRVGLNWARSILRRRRGPARVVYDADHVDLPSIADPAIHRALGRLPVASGWSLAPSPPSV